MCIKFDIQNQSKYAQREFEQCKIIGENSRKIFLYKYMDMKAAILSIRNKELRFVEPTRWKDQYEKMYYTSNYTNVEKCGIFPLTLFANCFTKERVSEASWRMYANKKTGLSSHCVQFKINRSNLRKELNSCMLKFNGTIYEGQCNYVLDDYEIPKLALKSSPRYTEIFESNFDLSSFLSLLLIKRKCFQYENECRFFIIPSNDFKLSFRGRNKTGRYLSLPLDWSTFVEKIFIDEKCPNKDFDSFKVLCEEAKLPKPEYNSLYNTPKDIPLPITIE